MSSTDSRVKNSYLFVPSFIHIYIPQFLIKKNGCQPCLSKWFAITENKRLYIWLLFFEVLIELPVNEYFKRHVS